MHHSLHDGTWRSIVDRIGEVADLETTARQFGALRRVRKVRRAEDLLRLGLIYGPGHHSLRSTAAVAADGDIVNLSDKGVLGRLRKLGDWFEHLLNRLLEQNRGLDCGEGLNLALVDGTLVCEPGSRGNDWRLHARFDPGRGCFADLVLTRGVVAERVDRTQIAAGQIVVQDRGYARVRDFAAVLEARADFITRIGWNSLRLRDPEHRRLDPLQLLPANSAPVEHVVRVKGVDRMLRLVIQRLPAEQAERQRKRVARRANRSGHTLDPRSAVTAGYLMLVTSLPQATQPCERIFGMYRNRWQIELGFKRLKTIGGLDKLPATDPALARTWLLSHLIVAVLTDEISTETVAFPP